MKFVDLPSEQICEDGKQCEYQEKNCELYHPDEFCLICDERLGDLKLYVEVHGKWGWSIDLPQAERFYICWECIERTLIRDKNLLRFFKKKGG